LGVGFFKSWGATMTPAEIETATRLLSVFLPYAMQQRERVTQTNGRFVHYTSAENALKIINSKRIWMRNTTCMTDFREVIHGRDALNRYFNQERKRAFIDALDECNRGAAEGAFALFDQWWQNTQLQTYITSISEHDPREDLHGRLSMWRAFGGSSAARVAIVIRLQLGIGTNLALGSTLSPVRYFTDDELAREFDAVIANVRTNRDFLRAADRNTLINAIFGMLTTAVVCSKHEGFIEEREWRVIHAPRRTPSAILEHSVEVVGGIPQIVYKIPLENNAGAAITGLHPDELIDRVIIGPTQFPWAMYEACVSALDAAGVHNAATRVSVSQIPVRT
jgi:hypothetical protein